MKRIFSSVNWVNVGLGLESSARKAITLTNADSLSKKVTNQMK